MAPESGPAAAPSGQPAATAEPSATTAPAAPATAADPAGVRVPAPLPDEASAIPPSAGGADVPAGATPAVLDQPDGGQPSQPTPAGPTAAAPADQVRTALADAAPTATGVTTAPAPLTTPGPAPAEQVRAVRPAVLELARGLRTGAPGHASLVVRLDPPELGAVLVRVVVRGDSVSVTCRSADAGAVGALQQQRGDLVDVLRREGLDLGDFDVRHDGGPQAPGRDAPGDPRDPRRPEPERARPRPAAAAGGPTRADDDPPRRPGTWL